MDSWRMGAGLEEEQAEAGMGMGTETEVERGSGRRGMDIAGGPAGRATRGITRRVLRSEGEGRWSWTIFFVELAYPFPFVFSVHALVSFLRLELF